MHSIIRRLTKSALRSIGREKQYFLFREVANELGISSVTVDGTVGRLEGNVNDWTIFRRYVHGEAWGQPISDLCIDFFRKRGKGTFIDVGANIGTIFIPVVSKSGSFGIAIDASPENFSYLANNCMRNLRPASYELHGVAVGDRPGKVQFDTSSINFGDHKVSSVGNIEVDVMRFDDMCDVRKLMKPILVKVDIQGYEGEFMSGAPTLLKACDAMIIEYSPFCRDDPSWISEVDRTILQNFSYVSFFQESGGRAMPGDFVALSQKTLDDSKHRIAAKKWHHPKDGHENVLLVRSLQ